MIKTFSTFEIFKNRRESEEEDAQINSIKTYCNNVIYDYHRYLDDK